MKRRHFLILCLTPAIAHAHSYKRGLIDIGHAWALPSRQNDGQLFFPIVNNGKESDALVAARSPICAVIELRSNARYDDPALNEIELLPGRPVPMRPSARHLRLIGLRQALKEDDRFTVILDFLNSGEMEIEAVVETAPGD
ncbi:MAG: copper chaperone PCu(A)C [Rhizobiales bacterium]|nr:copper chaperone PCu(A)C [Hyphomicrobiales bacterium]